MGGGTHHTAHRGPNDVFAGATLFTSILLSSFLQPGSLLLSLATALVVVTPISVAIAWIALPALLALLGERINWARSGGAAAGRDGPAVAAAADAALRRPALAAALIAVPLALLAAPALAFNTGAPGISELPRLEPGSSKRRSDRSRRRPGLGGSLRDRRRGSARPDHDAATGSRCSSARSAASSPARRCGR